MLNIDVFKPLVHKKIFKGFCYINLYNNMTSWGVVICDPRDFICTNVNLLVLRMLYAKYQSMRASRL